MERNLFAYIWSHTRKQQLWIICVTLLAMIPYYLSFDLPKQIINAPISGIGFENPGDTLPFARFEYDLPLIGHVVLFPGIQLQRIPLLFALSCAFLALVVVNGIVKIYLNTYKGRLGERLLRRIRYDLIDRILRFPPRRFKSVKAGEVASMVKDEVEPFGGFSGEAFAAPVMLAGQALTAMAFIFVQHVGLGCVALVMALIQVLIIPRLRARLIVLGRQRQLTARQLSGRVAEIVEGIDTIRGSDATNYIRADIVDRLGQIFRIRYDLFRWKFIVKFLNNFIAQLTPFLFYSIGGYLAIKGRLDVGQLVAVINAYKELPGPMKGLIDWDMARQDIQVKYEGIVSQFDLPEMIAPAIQKLDREDHALGTAPLQLRGLALVDDSGTSRLGRTSVRFAPGEAVALVGGGASGADALAEAIGRLVWPSEGAVQIGDEDILHLPEAVSGRRITFASPQDYFFSGSMRDNLLFRLNNAPREAHGYNDEEAAFRDWWNREAELTGNPILDLNDRWIDEASVLAHAGVPTLGAALQRVLDIVGMREDVVQLGMKAPLDPARDGDLAASLLELRGKFRSLLAERGWQDLILPFDPEEYNEEATILENLYFGSLADPEAATALGTSEVLRRIARETGLEEALFAAGWQIARTATALMRDLPEDHPFQERMGLMTAGEIDEYERLLERNRPGGFETATPQDQARLVWLCAGYSERRYRFGVLSEKLRQKILTARRRLRAEAPQDLSERVEFYDPDRYLFQRDIAENVLFGRINSLFRDADQRVAELGLQLQQDHPDLVERIMHLGLDLDVGTGGRKLSPAQRGRLNLARALLRSSDIYVFNQVLLGSSQQDQGRIINAALRFLCDRPQPPLVIWVLPDAMMASGFDRVLTFEAGQVLSDRAGKGSGTRSEGGSEHADVDG